jgi:hypothetical protein
MVFRRRVVQEDVPVVTPVVTPVQQPVIEHTTTVERDSMSGSAAIAVIFAGLLVLALVWYFAWYQPQVVATQPSSNTTIIDHDRGTAAQPIVTTPSSTPVIVNPPASPAPSNTTIVNPPATNTTVVTPPDTSQGTTTTTTDQGSTTTTTTDNNGG